MGESKSKWRKGYTALIIALLVLSYFYSNLFPGNFAGITNSNKPVILYYNYAEQPFKTSDFPNLVSFASSHGFNTLMIVVYINHEAIFNKSVLQGFYSYAKSQNITFVPSFYIESLNDTINVSGFSWVNLDMEKLSQVQQRIYYDTINSSVPLVSVTMPYGVSNYFQTRMLIVESYASEPVFWLEQMSYSHYGAICSVHMGNVNSEQEYLSEFKYCLKYSEGVMVFDYPSLAKAGY